MNKVILHGKIVTDIIKKNDKAPAEFRLETVSEWRGEQIEGHSNNEFHDIVVWGDKGLFVHKAFRKGDYVLLEGMIKYKKKMINIRSNDGLDVIVDGKPLVITKSDVEIKVISIEKT
jgi:single-stranded DNA-binding protein